MTLRNLLKHLKIHIDRKIKQDILDHEIELLDNWGQPITLKSISHSKNKIVIHTDANRLTDMATE